MAREGYLIMDSDLHMMEPDDLWARYLDGPYRANPPRFFGGQQQQLAESSEDKGNADTIMGMEVQGLAIPAHAKRRARPPPAASCGAAAAPATRISMSRGRAVSIRRSTLTAMDIEGIDVAVDVRHARPADPVSRRSGARLCRGARARLQQLGRRLLQGRSAAPQIRRADRDARHPDARSRRRAAA